MNALYLGEETHPDSFPLGIRVEDLSDRGDSKIVSEGNTSRVCIFALAPTFSIRVVFLTLKKVSSPVCTRSARGKGNNSRHGEKKAREDFKFEVGGSDLVPHADGDSVPVLAFDVWLLVFLGHCWGALGQSRDPILKSLTRSQTVPPPGGTGRKTN